MTLDDGTAMRVHFLSPDEAPTMATTMSSPIPLLWFLQHSMWDVPRAPVIDRATWQAWEDGYVAVNRLFADAIAQQVRATSRPTLVMLQDYHLYLVARYCAPALRTAASAPRSCISSTFPGPVRNTGASCRPPCGRRF